MAYAGTEPSPTILNIPVLSSQGCSNICNQPEGCQQVSPAAVQSWHLRWRDQVRMLLLVASHRLMTEGKVDFQVVLPNSIVWGTGLQHCRLQRLCLVHETQPFPHHCLPLCLALCFFHYIYPCLLDHTVTCQPGLSLAIFFHGNIPPWGEAFIFWDMVFLATGF